MTTRYRPVSSNKKILVAGLLLILIGIAGGTMKLLGKSGNKIVVAPPTRATTQTAATSDSLPASVLLSVPFTPQAPFAVWDNFHEEACEEAAMLMAMHYVHGEGAGLLNPTAVDAELHAEVDWETQAGMPQDLTAAQAVQVFKGYYGYSGVSLSTGVSVESIKAQLAKGFLVILPEAGRELHNPDYTAPGPWYHFILIKGYDAKGNFITNDAGIRQGNGWVFPQSVLISANHDWAGQDPLIDQGRRVMIIVQK
jgi:hypothetical protein